MEGFREFCLKTALGSVTVAICLGVVLAIGLLVFQDRFYAAAEAMLILMYVFVCWPLPILIVFACYSIGSRIKRFWDEDLGVERRKE